MNRSDPIDSTDESTNPAGPPPAPAAAPLPAVASLLPHRRAMLLIDRVVAFDRDGWGVVEARILAGKPYGTSAPFPTAWLIEIMAQSVGAIFALQQAPAPDAGSEPASAAPRPAVGYLL